MRNQNPGRISLHQCALFLGAVTLLTTSHFALGQIIPASRTANWSSPYVGVPGGIPHRTIISTTLNAGATESQIQSAINSCPSNQVVLLGPGTYTISSGLSFGYRGGVTLRGSGTSTVLKSAGGGQVIHIGANSLWNPSLGPHQWDAGTTIVSGSTKGSTNLVLSSSPGLAVGQLVLVDQNNDTTFVFDETGSGQRAVSQTVVVQAVNGSSVTVWPPLLTDFQPSLDARLKTLGSPAYQNNFSGIEDLKIDGSGSGAATVGIVLEQCYGCWLSNVVLSLIPNYHVTMTCSARLSVSHCSCLDVPVHGPNHYGFGLEASTCSSLIENSIVNRIFPGIEVNYGCSGNVVAYNFVWDAYQDNFGNGACIDDDHGPHNIMNLYEGNVAGMFQADGYFGSSSHGTLLRNWLCGWGPTYTTANSKCISLNRFCRYYNILGNLLGTNTVAREYDMTASGDSTPTIYQLGYPNMGNGSYTGTAPPAVYNNPGSGPSDNQARDLNVGTTILRHGNYDVVTATNKGVVWDPTIADHNIPSSYYLGAKPAWFGNLAWPPFDPLTVSAAMLSPTNIPAGYRFIFGVDPPSGPPDTTPPSAPSALSAVAAGSSQINLSWAASTDNVGVTGYLVERQAPGSSTFVQVGTSSATTYSDTGLRAGTNYSYRVRATDAAGNLSPYSGVASATTMAADTQPPSSPANLVATAASSSQINLSWSASTDNVGVTGYLVERSQGSGSTSFTQVATPAGTSFSDTGLAASTTYNYRVRATDAAGNLSGYSTTATAITSNAPPDTTPPSVPTGVTAAAMSSNQINLSWTASTDNVAVTGYLVERSVGTGSSSYSQVGSPAGTSFSDIGLSASTAYNYRVRATDAAGNLSGYSTTATASTTSGNTPSGLVAAYGFEEASGTSVNDGSGNGNTGAVNAATWATGKYGGALSFNGSSSYVDLGNPSALNLTGSMTLSAWVMATSTPPDDGQIIAKSDNVSGWQLKTTADTGVETFGVAVSPDGTSHVQRYSQTVRALNTWYYVAGVYNASAQTLDIYVNGALDNGTLKGTVPASQFDSSVNVNIGARSGGFYFNGLIDEVRIYNRALSAAEIQSDMASPVVPSVRPPPPTGLRIVGR